MNKQNVTLKKAMIEALEQSLGIVTTACKKVGINRKTHYDWLKTDEDYAAR
jgi:transcriptional regulator of acetoin/glycerol metabolism